MNPTPIRTVRVPDDLWQAAQAKAKKENKELSTVIRRLLYAYTRT
jgi:hypothetical protein